MNDAATLIGSNLSDRYRLMEVIGEGGMGSVFRAEQVATGETVALKLLHPEFAGVDQVVQRFEREAKVTTELSHPNIVKVIEFGEWSGRLYLAMELLPGKSLGELIERGGHKSGRRLTVKRTLALMRPVLEALEYAHGLGVVHRDLKPENIMVIPGRGLLAKDSVKLLDFGIAKLGRHSERATQKLTQHGLVLGTPAYMSPEQAAGQEADVRSDIYSAGVILYQMLTGHQPFEGDSAIDVLMMHLNAKPKPLREIAPGAWIPFAVQSVVLRALAKRPAERYQSAGELRLALERAALIDYTEPGVSGTGPTVMATSSRRLSPGTRFLCLAIILAAATVLVGHHFKRRLASIGRQIASAGSADSARKSRVAAAPDPPPAAREPPRRATPEPVREQPKRPKQTVKQARPTTAKKKAVAKKPAEKKKTVARKHKRDR